MKYHTKKNNKILLMIIIVIIIIGIIYFFNNKKEGLDTMTMPLPPPFNPYNTIGNRINNLYNRANPTKMLAFTDDNIKVELDYFINQAIESYPNTYNQNKRCFGTVYFFYGVVIYPYYLGYKCKYANVYMSFESKLAPLLQQYNIKNKDSYLYQLAVFINLWKQFKNTNENKIWINDSSEKYSKLFHLFDLIGIQAAINPIIGVTSASALYSDLRADKKNYYNTDVNNFTNLSALLNDKNIIENEETSSIESTLTNEITKAFAQVMIQFKKCCNMYIPLTCSLDIITPASKSDKILSRVINDFTNNITYDIIYQLIRTKAITEYSYDATEPTIPVSQKANYGKNVWIDLDIILTSYRKLTYYDISTLETKTRYNLPITSL